MKIGFLRRIWCNIIAASFSMILVMPITYMLLDRDLPLTLHYDSFEPSIVLAGDIVTVTWTAKLFRNSCEGTFVRRIVDAGGFVTDTKPMKLDSFEKLNGRGIAVLSKTIIIPIMLPGPATYQIFTKYWCNPLQQYLWPITHTEDVLHFNVVGPLVPLQKF